MEIRTRVYRPRRPRESPLFRLVEQHLEEFLRVYPERFAKQHGPLRPVVERVLRGFIKCGDAAHGFCPCLVRNVSPELLDPVLVSRTIVLSLLREETLAALGRMAA